MNYSVFWRIFMGQGCRTQPVTKSLWYYFWIYLTLTFPGWRRPSTAYWTNYWGTQRTYQVGCVPTHIIYYNRSIILDTLSPKLCPVSQLSKQGGGGGCGLDRELGVMPLYLPQPTPITIDRIVSLVSHVIHVPSIRL